MENIETLLAAVAQTQGFDDDERAFSASPELGLQNSKSSPVNRGDGGGSQLTGEAPGSSDVVEAPPPAPATAFSPAMGQVIGVVEKRKRGRPPRGQVGPKPPPPKRIKVEDEEEDVCFICFDGGSLVLCDRKGCPKAYHPACIKRDEAFFKSKAKWNCGWHICSVCRKSSHYMCYTCTYSLCKGCTKDADYSCVRGNKGFCSTCRKTIMLIENKGQAANESVQVDFDDITTWEYLFKVYWVCLKEKLSLTLSELTQAKSPWKGVAAVAYRPRLSNVPHTAVGGEVSISSKATEHSELNKPHVEISSLQNDVLRKTLSSTGNHVEEVNGDKVEVGPGHNNDNIKPDEVSAEMNIQKATENPGVKAATTESGMEKDRNDPIIVKDTSNPCICKDTIDRGPVKPRIDSGTEWASKELLEFVAHMKNGDISAISQFDVQQLLLEYIKRNNLRDPRRKSQIVCDQRLTNLFGKPRVGHIEMLKLLEFHFLIKDDTGKNSFIPAGFVSSIASDMEVDGNVYGSGMQVNSRKRKTRKKSEEKTVQNNLDEYAAIDVHNINLIYLRRNIMEHLIDDHENFNNKVIGSIVRIRISSNDQKQDVYRLVQVVETSKVAEPYKIGDRTADVMLEVLNLDKKEVVSIDAISSQDFTEDECRRLRQSIRCGLVKQLTVGEVQKKAMALQTVRVNDWLEAEISRLSHLRDRASEKGRKKELRECVSKLQLLKTPEERQRRISEVPVIHADPKMDPNYESEEDSRIGDNMNKDEYVRPSYQGFPRNGRKPISPNKKGKEEQSIHKQTRLMEKTDASGSHSLDRNMNQVNITNSATHSKNDQAMQRSGLETSIATSSMGNSSSSDHIETEKLWHYRDPNGKIQGPFSMMQLRKWSTTGLFPPDMRIWTNHEQYDSLLLTDALNGKLHAVSEWSHKPSLGSHRNGAMGKIGPGEGIEVTDRDSKQTEAEPSNNVRVSSESNSGVVKADESGSSSWPRCWDLLKDGNSSADNVQTGNSLPSSSPEKTNVLPDRGQAEVNHGSQNAEKSATGLTENPMNSGLGLQVQPTLEHRTVSSEENLRSLNIDLSSIHVEPGPVYSPVSTSPEPSKQACDINVLELPSPTPNTAVNQQSVCLDVPLQNSGILELLSPTPRSNDEQAVQATDAKQSGFIKSPMPNSGVGGAQLPQAADEWCGYSPTPGKASVQEWDSGLVSASSSRPPEVATSEDIATLNSDTNHHMHVSPSFPQSSNLPNWLSILNEPIEFDALGEESVSDLLAEVDAMEMQGTLPSPTSAMKFARELLEDCKDDCFSSIEDFSPTRDLDPRKSDAFSSTGEVQLTSQSSVPHKPIGTSPIDAFDFFRRSNVHSSASSEGETNAPVCSMDAGSTNQDMVGAAMAHVIGPETMDPGRAMVQGNINLVTVQGNVNLVLGGPSQGMGNLNWGPNQGTTWGNPNMNCSPINVNLPWEGQRKFGGERFTSPREWGGGYQGGDSGFGRGRAPWGRQPYGGGGGGYSRPVPRGQRVCKFYESGHCKKGAFCDYLHP